MNKIEVGNYGDFIQLVRDRDDQIQKPDQLVNFLLQNSEYVQEGMENAKDCQLLADRVAELSVEDLGDRKTRKTLQELFQKVPQFQAKSADRKLKIGEVEHPVHFALLAAQDEMLLSQMEAVGEENPCTLGDDFSENARLAYMNNLERIEPISGEHVLEVLVIASRDNNKALTKYLWGKLHTPGRLLSDVLGAWIHNHMDLEDPFGAFIDEMNRMQKMLPEVRKYETLDRHELFKNLTDLHYGHPAFREERETKLSDTEREVAKKILNSTNPAYLHGKHNKEIRSALRQRLLSDDPLIDPVKVNLGDKEFAYFPIVVASHCEQLRFVSLDGESKPCWLSKDTVRFPLDLQFEVLKALSDEKVGEQPPHLDAWSLLELAELQGIGTLREIVQKRILAHTSIDQLFEKCLENQVKEPLIDFLNKAYLLGKVKEGCERFKISLSLSSAERRGQVLNQSISLLNPKILESGAFSSTLTELVRQLPDIEQRQQLLASLLIRLDKNFIPSLFLDIMSCCLKDKAERASMFLKTNMPEESWANLFGPQKNTRIEDQKLSDLVIRQQLDAVLKATMVEAEDALLQEILDAADKAGGVPNTLRLYCDAHSESILKKVFG